MQFSGRRRASKRRCRGAQSLRGGVRARGGAPGLHDPALEKGWQARRPPARGAPCQAQRERAIHARRVGLPGRARRGGRADHGRLGRRDRRRCGRARPPRRRDPRACRGGGHPARPLVRARPMVAVDHPGAHPDPLRHALLPGAGARPLPAQGRRPGGHRRGVDEPAGRARTRRGGRDRARLPHDQAARVTRALRDRRRSDGRRPRHGRRADHAERRRGRLRVRAGACSCPATTATSRQSSSWPGTAPGPRATGRRGTCACRAPRPPCGCA